jgi:hypothetical protein
MIRMKKFAQIAAGIATVLVLASPAGAQNSAATCVEQLSSSMKSSAASDWLASYAAAETCISCARQCTSCGESASGLLERCGEQRTAAASHIGRVVVLVNDASGSPVNDAEVLFDGRPAKANSAFDALEGARKITVRLAGEAPKDLETVVVPQSANRVEVVFLRGKCRNDADCSGGLACSAARVCKVPEPAAAPAAPAKGVVATEPAPSRPTAYPAVGGVLLGLGGVALVTGGIFGGIAASKKPAGCTGNVCNTSADTDAFKSAQSTANVSTIVFVSGAAVSLVGAGVLAFAPWREKVDVSGATDGKSGAIYARFRF